MAIGIVTMLQNQTPQPQYSMQQKNLSCPQPCLNFQFVLLRTELLLLLANGKFSFSADVKDSQQKFDLLKLYFGQSAIRRYTL